MTILPKKKINNKEKIEQQRYALNQRHFSGSGSNHSVSSDHARFPYSSGSNYNYPNVAGSHFPSNNGHDTNHARFSRGYSENLINNWMSVGQTPRAEDLAHSLSNNSNVPNTFVNHGGVSKRKKKRDCNLASTSSMLSVKPSSRNNNRVEPSESSKDAKHSEQPGTSNTPNNAFPSPPHQNSEDEYENQTEVSSQERELRFKRQLKAKKGFLVKKMREDGACLFRAISDQIYGDQDMHSIIRNLVCDYMMKNRDFFHQFVTEDFNKYIERKRVDNEHGNHVELQAISEMYNRPIEIYIYEAEPSNVIQSLYGTDNTPIRLSYHNNMHYNSVVDPYGASVGVGLGLPSFTPGVADKNQLKDAMRASESQYIEQAMYEDKLRATDWEATSDTISEAILRESRLQFMRDQEKQISSSFGVTSSCHSSTSPRSSPGYSANSSFANVITSSQQQNCGKPCCSYTISSPPMMSSFVTSQNSKESSVGGGGGGDLGGGMAASTASCCLTKCCAANHLISISASSSSSSPAAAMMSQQQQSGSSPHHHIHSPRAVTSSPRASFSPNSASGNKSPVMPALSNYGVMGFGNASGSQSPGGACRQQQQSSPCPSPDSAAAAAAMCYSLWPPNSPKNMYPTAGDHLMDSAMSTNSDNQQQQQEYDLLRALMESQLEYYNSFSRSRRSSPSAGSPQPGPSTS